MKQLKNEGKAELNFIPDSKFINKFELDNKPIRFQSHQQLDRLMKEFHKIDKNFKLNHPEEYSLLKSFGKKFNLKKNFLKHSTHRSSILVKKKFQFQKTNSIIINL